MDKFINPVVAELFYDIFKNVPLTIKGTRENPFFLATEISFLLGLDFKCNTSPIHRLIIDDETFINQTGLYTMIMKSETAECSRFREAILEGCFPSVKNIIETLSENNEEVIPVVPKKKEFYSGRIHKVKSRRTSSSLCKLLESMSL